MDLQLRKLPVNIILQPFSIKVFIILEKYTSFPWPILQAQCKRHGINPAQISIIDYAKVEPDLVTAIGKFISPEKAAAAAQELHALRVDRPSRR